MHNGNCHSKTQTETLKNCEAIPFPRLRNQSSTVSQLGARVVKKSSQQAAMDTSTIVFMKHCSSNQAFILFHVTTRFVLCCHPNPTRQQRLLPCQQAQTLCLCEFWSTNHALNGMKSSFSISATCSSVCIFVPKLSTVILKDCCSPRCGAFFSSGKDITEFRNSSQSLPSPQSSTRPCKLSKLHNMLLIILFLSIRLFIAP